jgi:hypothetical protein
MAGALDRLTRRMTEPEHVALPFRTAKERQSVAIRQAILLATRYAALAYRHAVGGIAIGRAWAWSAVSHLRPLNRYWRGRPLRPSSPRGRR